MEIIKTDIQGVLIIEPRLFRDTVISKFKPTNFS